jgi:hypothetical protein
MQMSLSAKFRQLSDPVTYPVTEALARWNGQFTDEALARVYEVMTKDMRTAHRSDGTGRIRPSMLGNICPRPMLLSYEGEPQDRESNASRSIMSAGTWRHYYWQAVGLSAGFLTAIEVPVELPGWKLKGNLDGQMANGEVFELKSVNSRRFSQVKGDEGPNGYSPIDSHVEQVHPYMKATKSEWTSMVYEDRNYLGFVEVRVHYDGKIMAELSDKVELWADHIRAGTLPPIRPDCLKQTGSVFDQCKWKESCFRVG